jgi:O-acetyl-ADP-ribose deacetylase (regulator of RNase III)
VAFPSISTGAFRFPLKRASEIARYEIQYFLKKNDVISKVIMACLDGETFKTYRTAFGIE